MVNVAVIQDNFYKNFYGDEESEEDCAERNEAMKILYDTFIALENSNKDDVYKILCDYLVKLTKGDYVTFSSYDECEKKIKIKAAYQGTGKEGFSNVVGHEVVINEQIYSSLVHNKILKCCGGYCFVSNIYPGETRQYLGCQGDKNCYQLSCMCDGKLFAFASVKMHVGRLLRLRDIVDLFLNMSGILLSRLNASQELKQSLSKLEIKNELIKKQQTQIVNQEKMATMGQLVAGVAHEINNPLNYMMGNLFVLEDYIATYNDMVAKYDKILQKYKLDDAIKEIENIKKEKSFLQVSRDIFDIVRETEHGSQRVADIVQNLKSFSRANVKDYRNYDINEGIKSTLIITGSDVKQSCELDVKYGDIGLVKCNLGQLNQVFLNLILNAVQSMSEYGKLTIRTFKEKETIVITIKDTGHGIKEEDIDKIFDPFYTTKPIGKGTGLGLPISKDIIINHGGQIFVESELNKGSLFKVILPSNR